MFRFYDNQSTCTGIIWEALYIQVIRVWLLPINVSIYIQYQTVLSRPIVAHAVQNAIFKSKKKKKTFTEYISPSNIKYDILTFRWLNVEFKEASKLEI